MFSKLCHDHPEPVVTAEILPLCKGTVMHESTRGIGRRSAGMHGIEPAICNREKVSLQQWNGYVSANSGAVLPADVGESDGSFLMHIRDWSA